MRSWIATVVVLGVAAAIAYMTISMDANHVECEACIEFEGRTRCGMVRGVNREEAKIAAVMNACSSIAHGVTETIACQRTIPRSFSCIP